MATLDELRADVFPAARLADGSPPEVDATVVGWVRVLRARVPAFDTLEPGDLVVVPSAALAVVAPSEGELAELVAAFARARIAAILLVGQGDDQAVTGRGDAQAGMGRPEPIATEPAIVGAARDAGLPALLLPVGDPVGLERTVIGYLVNRRAELEHQAGQLEQRLERLALDASDLPALVAEVGASLGRPVALEGRRGDALAVHAPPGDAASAGAVARYLAGGGGVVLRVRLPGSRPGGGDAGSLALLGEQPPTELERVASERIAGLLALQLARDEAVRRARDAGRRADTLPAAGPPWVVLLARQVEPGADPGLEAREATRRELRLLAPNRRMALRGDAESLELRLVLAADDEPRGLVLAGRIAAFLGRTVALSRPFSAPGDRPAAEADARATLEAIEVLVALETGRPGPRVARADHLAAYRLLGGLHNLPDGRRHAHELLAPLLAGSPARVGERLATLRAVLDSPGVAEAAAALGIHRNTLAYRVRRIEALTGWRLGDPELRLPLQIALRLVQTAQ